MGYRTIDIRTWVKGLLVDCPLGTPLESCPANKIRSLPLHDIVRLANSLSEKKLSAIVALHEKCVRQREQGGGS
jgi:hypothetical protein